MTRVAGWSVRRPWRALSIWLVVTVALGALGTGLVGHLSSTSIDVPGTASSRVEATIESAFGSASEVPVLLVGPRSDVLAQRRSLVRELERTSGARVTSVPSTAFPQPVSGDTRRVLVVARLASEHSFDGDAAERVQRAVDGTITEPVSAAVTGFSAIGGAVSTESVDAAHDAELIAIPILLIVLLLVFRSPVAAGIPALLGIATVVSAYGLVDVVAQSRDITDVATPLTSMLGLALGVDYALLLVSRFREYLAQGLPSTTLPSLRVNLRVGPSCSREPRCS